MALYQITRKLREISEKAVSYTMIGMMAVMTITIIIQVFLRYIFSYSLSWSEEVARYLMIWVAFLGGSLALKKGLHIGVELVVTRLDPGVKRWVVFFSQLLIFLFLVFLTIGGIELTWAVRDQSSPALLFSMSLAYLSAPVGGLFMAIQSFHLLIKEWVKA